MGTFNSNLPHKIIGRIKEFIIWKILKTVSGI